MSIRSVLPGMLRRNSASLALLAVTAAVVDSNRWFVVIGAGLLVVIVLMTVTVMVPLNNRIAAWRSAGEVSRGLAARWDRLHWVRVALLAVTFVLRGIGVLSV